MVITLKKDPAPPNSPADGSIIATDEWNKLVDLLSGIDTDKIPSSALEPGAGGSTFARVVKKVDEIVNNSQVFQNDDELFVPLNANKVYGFWICIFLESTVTADLKANFIVPTGTTGRKSDSSWSSIPRSTTDITQALIHAPLVSTEEMFVMLGHINVAGTPGNFQFEWAQNLAEATDTKVKAGSFLIVWEELS